MYLFLYYTITIVNFLHLYTNSEGIFVKLIRIFISKSQIWNSKVNNNAYSKAKKVPQFLTSNMHLDGKINIVE